MATQSKRSARRESLKLGAQTYNATHCNGGIGDCPGATIITEPTSYDVLFGRGRCYQEHFGNERLLKIVESKKPRYQKATNRHVKANIVNETIRLIQDTAHQQLANADADDTIGSSSKSATSGSNNEKARPTRARFLKQHSRGSQVDKKRYRRGQNSLADAQITWYEAAYDDVFKKVSHCLREKLLGESGSSPSSSAAAVAAKKQKKPRDTSATTDSSKKKRKVVNDESVHAKPVKQQKKLANLAKPDPAVVSSSEDSCNSTSISMATRDGENGTKLNVEHGRNSTSLFSLFHEVFLPLNDKDARDSEKSGTTSSQEQDSKDSSTTDESIAQPENCTSQGEYEEEAPSLSSRQLVVGERLALLGGIFHPIEIDDDNDGGCILRNEEQKNQTHSQQEPQVVLSGLDFAMDTQNTIPNTALGTMLPSGTEIPHRHHVMPLTVEERFYHRDSVIPQMQRTQFHRRYSGYQTLTMMEQHYPIQMTMNTNFQQHPRRISN